MNTDARFSSENFLISVCGHLALVAVLITSAAIVFERAKLVAPDRIQIMEIDLDAVKVSGDKTVLYNVGTPEQRQQAESKSEPKSAPEPEPVADDKPIETPSLVDDKPNTKTENAADKKTDAPVEKKKKTLVRVNREVVSLDRTLTVSVVDALRVAMTRCWVIDTKRPDIDNIRAVAHMTLRPNGTVRDVWFESAARAETDAAFAYVLDTIRAAINTCQPFKMLPPNEFDKWERVQLTFYPTTGAVM